MIYQSPYSKSWAFIFTLRILFINFTTTSHLDENNKNTVKPTKYYFVLIGFFFYRKEILSLSYFSVSQMIQSYFELILFGCLLCFCFNRKVCVYIFDLTEIKWFLTTYINARNVQNERKNKKRNKIKKTKKNTQKRMKMCWSVNGSSMCTPIFVIFISHV